MFTASNADLERPLLDQAELERLRRITLQHRARRRAPAGRPGEHATRLRGQGMELHDVRAYQPGDDIRHLDWRATARSGKPVTKVFVEERSRHLILLIDRRPSMLFGTRRELKAGTAARAAAALAFSALAGRGSVAGVVLRESAHYFAPAAGLAAALPLLTAAAAPLRDAAPKRAERVDFRDLPAFLERRIRRGALIGMISDFDDICAGRAALADYIPASRRCDRVAVHIVDAAEQTLSDAGPLRLVSPRGTRVLIDSGDPGLRRRYAARMAERAAAFERHCARQGAALYTLATHEDPLQALAALL